MKHTLAPFVTWSLERDHIVVRAPDNELDLPLSAAEVLRSVTGSWKQETEELVLLHQYGVTITSSSDVTEQLFKLQQYFTQNNLPLVIEKKGATIEAASIRWYGYRVTSPARGDVGFGQDGSRDLALLKAVVEFYERVSCDVCHNQELIGTRLPFCFSSQLYRFLPWQLGLSNFPYSELPSGCWVTVERVTDSLITASVPAEYMFYPDGIEGSKLCDGSSNGVAAHSLLTKALLGSILELIERDALMVHWFNKVARERIAFPKSFSSRIRRLAKLGFQVDAINLTLELMPVVLVILRRDAERYPRLLLGLASDPVPRKALDKALKEAELNVTYYNINVPAPEAASEVSTIMDHQFWYDKPKNHQEVESFIGDKMIKLSDIALGPKKISDIAKALEEEGYDWYCAELNTPGAKTSGIHVVRSIVPGLTPIGFGYRMEPLGMPRLRKPPQKVAAEANSYRQTKRGYRVQPFA